jgi:hypothetical protein
LIVPEWVDLRHPECCAFSDGYKPAFGEGFWNSAIFCLSGQHYPKNDVLWRTKQKQLRRVLFSHFTNSETKDIRRTPAIRFFLKDLKPAARYFAGSQDGQFYLDEDEHSGQSSLRFVWKRPK